MRAIICVRQALTSQPCPACPCPCPKAGSLEPVPDEGLEEAAALMFPRHPEMLHWPKGHQFRL